MFEPAPGPAASGGPWRNKGSLGVELPAQVGLAGAPAPTRKCLRTADVGTPQGSRPTDPHEGRRAPEEPARISWVQSEGAQAGQADCGTVGLGGGGGREMSMEGDRPPAQD